MISNLLLTYLIIGPGAWPPAFLATQMGRYRMGRLKRWKRGPLENPPKVTILIPAKDEGAGIRKCIDAALALDYPNYDVVAIDDRSTDDTGVVLDEIAARDRRLRVIQIKPGALPEGWLGKCHALHVGAISLSPLPPSPGTPGEGRGEGKSKRTKDEGGRMKQDAARTRDPLDDWLFFVDSDVTLAPDALAKAISIAVERKYDALSILTRLECHGFLEELMLPVLGGAWSIMHTVSKTNQDHKPLSAYANGQFFLIRRSAYESVGGHESVRDQITEDVELMRLLKGNEFKVRFFMGSHLASTRMHSNLKQMFNGWGRIYSGTMRRRPWRILCAILFLLTAIYSVYPALAYGVYRAVSDGNAQWLAASSIHFALMTLYIGLIYFWSGNRARFALLIPVSGALQLAIFVFSLHKCWTGKITWRDTHFSSKPAPSQGQA